MLHYGNTYGVWQETKFAHYSSKVQQVFQAIVWHSTQQNCTQWKHGVDHTTRSLIIITLWLLAIMWLAVEMFVISCFQ